MILKTKFNAPAAPIGVGVIGLGYGRAVVIPALALEPRCRLVGVASSTPSRSAEAAAALGLKKVFSNWSDLVASPDVQLVVVAVPPRLQSEIALAALRHGKALLCEKPLAIHNSEALRIEKLAAETGVPCHVDFLFPRLTPWARLKRELDGKSIGDLKHVNVSWRVRTRAYSERRHAWKLNPELGGGVTLNFVPHTVHYLQWLFGPLAEIQARALPSPQNEARLDLWFRFASGLSGTGTFAIDAYDGGGHRVEVHGCDGQLTLQNPMADTARGFTLTKKTDGPATLLQTCDISPEIGDGRIEGVRRLLNDMVTAVLAGETLPDVSVSAAARVQEWLDAILESAKKGHALPADEKKAVSR